MPLGQLHSLPYPGKFSGLDNVRDYLIGLRSSLYSNITGQATTVYNTVPGRGWCLNALDYGAVCDGVTDDFAGITAAIAACPTNGEVLVPGPLTTVSDTLHIDKTMTLKVIGKLQLSTASQVGISIGTVATRAERVIVEIDELSGIGPTHGQIAVQLNNCVHSTFRISHADNLANVVKVVGTVASAVSNGENVFYFTIWHTCDKAVYIPAATTCWAEGLQFYGGAIFICNYGVHIESGPNAGGILFCGCIDNVDVTNSHDWVNSMGDTRLGSIIVGRYMRTATCTFQKYDMYLEPNGPGGIRSYPDIVSHDGTSSGSLLSRGAALIWNANSNPLLYFSDSEAGTNMAVIQKDTNHDLSFLTGGSERLLLLVDGTIKMNHYTTDGFVKFTGSTGTLGVDASTYLGSGATAVDSDKLDGYHASSFLKSVTAHNILSATHGDATVGAVSRGGLITGQGISPTWTTLVKGTSGYFLKAGADDIGWSAHGLTYSDVGALASGGTAADSDKVDGYHASSFLQSVTAHQLDGVLHTVSGLTSGHFLKATGAATFGFAAHGLSYSDVGALASGGTAADSDKVDGQHAAAFLAVGATAADSSKWAGYTFSDYLDQAVKQASTPTFGGVTLGTKQIGTTTRAKGYRSAALANMTTGWQKILLDAESYDDGNNFDPVTNHRFVAPVTGYYLVTAMMNFATVHACRIAFSVYKSGAELNRVGDGAHGASDYPAIGGSDIVYLTANQYLELYYYIDQSDGSFATGAGNTYLAVHLLSV